VVVVMLINTRTNIFFCSEGDGLFPTDCVPMFSVFFLSFSQIGRPPLPLSRGAAPMLHASPVSRPDSDASSIASPARLHRPPSQIGRAARIRVSQGTRGDGRGGGVWVKGFYLSLVCLPAYKGTPPPKVLKKKPFWGG